MREIRTLSKTLKLGRIRSLGIGGSYARQLLRHDEAARRMVPAVSIARAGGGYQGRANRGGLR